MIAENKKRIASELEKPIHTFAYLFGSKTRFDSSTQEIFELLNEWTMVKDSKLIRGAILFEFFFKDLQHKQFWKPWQGNIWDNFVIIFNLASFSEAEVQVRYNSMFGGQEELFWKIQNDKLKQGWIKIRRDNIRRRNSLYTCPTLIR